jgi:hypothetical protein
MCIELRTTAGPTPFLYRYTFIADGSGTTIEARRDD